LTIGPYIDDVHKEYINSVGISSKKLYDILLRELAQHTNQGNLEANKQQLAQLDSIIKQALKDSGYSKATDQYFNSFNKIEQHNDDYYGSQKLSIKPAIDNSQIIPHIKEQVLSSLRGNGANEGIIKPLENLMRQEIFLNKTYQETADLLKRQLVDKPLLIRHVDQVAFDALRQYNGAINDEVRKTYNLKHFFYIGSEIETTRPICDHIRDNYKGAISIDQLKIILDEFCPNGIPSDVSITYETVNGVKRTAKKGAGMYDGTTVENFCQNCGGNRCRHEVKWVRNPEIKPKPQPAKKTVEPPKRQPVEPNTDIKKDKPILLIDTTGLLTLISGINKLATSARKLQIDKIKNLEGMKKAYSIKVKGVEKTVHVPDDRKPTNDELEAAQKTAEAGFDVIFTSPSQFKNPKNSEKRFESNFDNYIVVNNKLKESDFKTNRTGTISSIENQFTSANKQAETLIIDMTTKISMNDLSKGIYSGILNSKNIKYALIIYKGKTKLLNRDTMSNEDELLNVLNERFNPRK